MHLQSNTHIYMHFDLLEALLSLLERTAPQRQIALQEGATSLQFAKWAAMKPVKKKRLGFLEDGFQR